ncbi:TrkH family potassium uptake protein [Shimazuella kribbensis]|uniref:TrkH family potassium uptake protein n=1 Tax=Shimazuella kribbensis TaxID=139808 RepID=UPI00040D67FE|nr:TrkH family potassium uptake protein [Shimazuella kribbensis]
MNYRRLSPPQIFLLFALSMVILGTILLKIPISTEKPLGWLDAWFMAISALTCTGLVTVDVGTTFTTFGQIILLLLAQIGGVGIMAFAALFFIFLGKRLSLKDRLVLNFSLNQVTFGNITALIKNLLLYVLTIECIGAIILFIHWQPQLPSGDALYLSIFHSVSSFNNAGLSLWPDSMMRHFNDPVLNIITTILVIIGGLGFTVLFDLREKKNFKKLTLHSKIMITGTFLLIVFGMVVIFLLEFQSAKSLDALALKDKMWTSYFQSVSLRSAGFNTIDIGALQESTLFFMCLLMFVGAGSTSTGGGIKVTTFTVILFAVIAFLRGKKQVHLFHRSIDPSFVTKCLAIASISLSFVALGVFFLTMVEEEPFLICLFEVMSAFGTVGLSANLTYHLSSWGTFIIGIMMFIGKVGPLTLLFSISQNEERSINYPKEDILIG